MRNNGVWFHISGQKIEVINGDIKPCPFCGESEILIWKETACVVMRCGSCDMEMREMISPVENSAKKLFERWNQRIGEA